MTRRDYVMIAGAINRAVQCGRNLDTPDRQQAADVVLQLTIAELGYVFSQDSERFDRERFENACRKNIRIGVRDE